MTNAENVDALEVFVNNAPVGVLSRDNEEFFDFRYYKKVDHTHAVSLTMPITEDPDEYVEFGLLPAPFQVSLPEGVVMERLRSLYKKNVNVDDPFDLLRLVGQNGIGRVTFGGKRSLAPVQVREILLRDARSVSAAQKLWNDMDRLGPEAFGVSGAMPKMLLDVKVPVNDRPTTLVLPSHIVKFDDPQHYGASLLEYVCMSACRRLGFPTPDLELSPSGDALIVQRFDMTVDGRYLGFEDACALAGYQRNQKYQGSIEELFDMARSFIPEDRQQEAIRDLTRMVLVNDILRNGDAHLKNFALLYDHPANAYWSPLYDVLNTTMFYPDDKPALSWDVEREVDQTWLEDPSALDALSRMSGQSTSSMKNDYLDIGDGILASIGEITRAMKDAPLDRDRYSFVDGLPRYFKRLLYQNRLFNGENSTFFSKGDDSDQQNLARVASGLTRKTSARGALSIAPEEPMETQQLLLPNEEAERLRAQWVAAASRETGSVHADGKDDTP